MKQSYSIHWFRRDLRVFGNEILAKSCHEFKGKTLGVFFFDSSFLSRPDFSERRFAFFLKTLKELRLQLQSLGGDLLVLDSTPIDGFKKLLTLLKEEDIALPNLITFNRDYEPFARSRDEAVTKLLRSNFEIAVSTERDHLILEPHEIESGTASFYQVFTPFSKKWALNVKSNEIQQRIETQSNSLKKLNQWIKNPDDFKKPFDLKWNQLLSKKLKVLDFFVDKLSEFEAKTKCDIHLPDAGQRAALQSLLQFKKSISQYKDQRDIPSIKGTSKISFYLKNGSLTTSEVLAFFKLEKTNPHFNGGESVYLKEIIWREFYYHILFHRPDVESQSFLPKYRNLKWENRENLFQAWCDGKTGYPIVDAGMRELNQTGWMHNRVRMIVASFLTKDLLIDWKWGERYFMKMLLDGDLASNNGGWQWAASTGCDPQPYFRVFNPTLQATRFDPDGIYIKKYCPERSQLSKKEVFMPINPIVDHQTQKLKVLRLYT